MRNIHIVNKFESTKGLKSISKGVLCGGSENNAIFACADVDKKVPKLLSLSPDSSTGEIVSEVICEDPTLQNVLQMEYNANSLRLFLVTKNGSFLQFTFDELEELFQSEAGISTFSVSPDSRLVVIITNDDKMLLLILSDLESLAQVPLNNDVSSKPSKICWRHDSKYFAVNYFDTASNSRRIKVFDETGGIFSTTETTSLIQPDQTILEWQPSGALIATLGLKDSKELIITLFEMNGLKRAEFDPSMDEKDPIVDLRWNSSSDILAIIKEFSIQLWYRDNYAWMCKQIIGSQTDGTKKDPIKFTSWDSDLNYRIHVIYKSGIYTSIDTSLEYNSGAGSGSGLCASISGNIVYYTPFASKCAPPPYGFSKVVLESQVQEVFVCPFWDGLMTILHNGKIIFFQNKDSNLQKYKSTLIPETFKGSYNWIWPEMSTLCCIQGGKVLTFTIQFESSKSEEILLVERGAYSENTTRICSLNRSMSETDFILTQQLNGSIHQINIKTGSIHLKAELTSPSVHFSLKYLIVDTNENSSLIILAFDLLSKKLLACIDKKTKKLCSDCSSFGTFEDKLLFTTMSGSLEIHGAEQIKAFIETETGISKPGDSYTRKVEKGSHIVSICLNTMKEPSLHMQILPRGNLETICPRPLILAAIRAELRANADFNAVLEAMRRHRIDFNILIDELKIIQKEGSGSTLEGYFQRIVRDLKNRDILINLITEMNEKNGDAVQVFLTVFKGFIDGGESSLVEMPYLATMAKLGLFDEALQSQLISSPGENREVVKKRVKFLSFYCDNTEILFESALGTYDLNLTAIVADCLNKDPKEYLPTLNELKSFPQSKLQYTIDNKLKRYGRAVESLIRAEDGNNTEIIKYTEKHRIYSVALKFLSSGAVPRNERTIELEREINLARGKHLEEGGRYREASIFYGRGQNWEKAIDLCAKCCSWEAALAIALKQEVTEEKLQSICKKIFQALEEREEYESCAVISEVYLKDDEGALNYWIKGRKWIRALANCTKSGRIDQIESLLKPALLSYAQTTRESIENALTEVQKYQERLKIVREAKEKATLNGDIHENGHFSDSESVSSFRSSTASSTYTGKTHRSGKNKRKAERKLFSLKEGSKFEDLAIAIHLWELFNRIGSEMKKDVGSCVEALWRIDGGGEVVAKDLSESFESLLTYSDKAIKFVWIGILPETPNLENKYRLPPANWTTLWDKLLFTD